jgi:hypothetical protein
MGRWKAKGRDHLAPAELYEQGALWGSRSDRARVGAGVAAALALSGTVMVGASLIKGDRLDLGHTTPLEAGAYAAVGLWGLATGLNIRANRQQKLAVELSGSALEGNKAAFRLALEAQSHQIPGEVVDAAVSEGDRVVTLPPIAPTGANLGAPAEPAATETQVPPVPSVGPTVSPGPPGPNQTPPPTN